MRAVALVVLAACGGGTRFLGERLPSACASSYSECAAQLELRTARDGFTIDDHALDAYVAAVEARIAKASTLDYVPRVFVMPVGSAAVLGRNIVIGRQMIVALGSEAELAGILAHETSHLEAGNNETSYIGDPPSEEAIADERAVVLLARAGYPPEGMANALARLGDSNDPMHPPMKLRIARTHLLAEAMARRGDGAGRDERRGSLMRVIDGRIVGWIRERGMHAGRAWVVLDRDITVPLPPEVTAVPDAADALGVWAGAVHYGAWRIGPRAGKEVIAELVDPERVELAVGTATIGKGRPQHDPPDGSLARLVASQSQRAGKVEFDEVGAIIDTPRGPLLVTVKGSDAASKLRTWLPLLRRPTAEERELGRSKRLQLRAAPRAGTVRELVADCVDPKAALQLDDPDRRIAVGQPFKCTDR